MLTTPCQPASPRVAQSRHVSAKHQFAQLRDWIKTKYRTPVHLQCANSLLLCRSQAVCSHLEHHQLKRTLQHKKGEFRTPGTPNPPEKRKATPIEFSRKQPGKQKRKGRRNLPVAWCICDSVLENRPCRPDLACGSKNRWRYGSAQQDVESLPRMLKM